MKRYYTVKEASKLLGLSTNTIYKYLNEGKLVSKRFGKGRFKILYTSLAPYIGESGAGYPETQPDALPLTASDQPPAAETENTFVTSLQEGQAAPSVINSAEHLNPALPNPPTTNTSYTNPINLENVSDQNYDQTGISSANDSEVKAGVNDVAFYRLFKGLALLGIGILYLTIQRERILPNTFFGADFDALLIRILPYLLILSGVFTVVGVIYYARLKFFHGWVQVLTILALGYYSFLELNTQNFGLFVFSGSLLIVTLTHFISGSAKFRFTFFSQFSKYLLFLILLGGVVVILNPRFFPFENAAEFIATNRGLTAIVWFGTFVPVLTILMNTGGQPLALLVGYLTAGGIMTLFIATQLTLKASWDASYMSFLTGIFTLFLAAWQATKTRLETYRLGILILAFVWIGSSLLFGIFAIQASQKQVKKQAALSASTNLEQAVRLINSSFEQQSSLLIASASNPEFKKALIKKDLEITTDEAKRIYNDVETAQRVLIYNEEGVAVSVYPHNSLVQGTNYSSRDYFSQTKSSYKGYISGVFKSVLGVPIIMQTEPIFEDNRFVGMIGLGISLEKLADKYQEEIGSEFDINVIDENGTYVFASQKELIGTKASINELVIDLNSVHKIGAYQTVRLTGWEAYIDAPVATLIQNISNMNIVVSVLLIVNAVLTVAAVLILPVRKGSVNTPGQPTLSNPVLNPM